MRSSCTTKSNGNDRSRAREDGKIKSTRRIVNHFSKKVFIDFHDARSIWFLSRLRAAQLMRSHRARARRAHVLG
jgi:hypothetical protein